MNTQITKIAWFLSIALLLPFFATNAISQTRGRTGRGGGWGDEKRELALPIALAIATAARNHAETCVPQALAANIAGFLGAAGDHYVGAGNDSKRAVISLEAGALPCLEAALASLENDGKLTRQDSANIRASYSP